MENVEQRTPEWHEVRCGKFTASEIYRLMSEPKSKSETLSEAAKTYVLEKFCEEITGYQVSIANDAMAWGIEHEALAIKNFTRYTKLDVKACGFYELNENAGGSPDGIYNFINSEGSARYGIIEVKCPFNSAKHIQNCLVDADNFKKELPSYYWQVQMNMLVTDAAEAYFISFDPRIDSSFGHHFFKVERNDYDINNLLNKIALAAEYKNYVKNKLDI